MVVPVIYLRIALQERPFFDLIALVRERLMPQEGRESVPSAVRRGCCPPREGRAYRGASLKRKRLPLGPYSRPIPRTLRWSCWVGAVLYERGTPVPPQGGEGIARDTHRPRLVHFSLAMYTYKGTSLTRKCTPLGPYRRPMPRDLGGSQGGGRFLMGEVPHVPKKFEPVACSSLLLQTAHNLSTDSKSKARRRSPPSPLSPFAN